MKLAGFLEKHLIAPGLKGGNKSTVIDTLLGIAEKNCPLGNRKKILDDLMVREKQSTTGIGCGIAVPHTIVETLPKTILVLASVPEGMEFHAVDREPVRVVFLLLSPPGRVKEHIKLLARIARICSSESLVRQIAESPSVDAIITAIQNEDERHVG
jgi:mannitol/fructose-specific phosphotransferase system IIA component (Ntr-type)